MIPAPKVWNKRDPNVPKDAVYVGRPSKWGNPFIVGVHGVRGECVKLYEEWIKTQSVLLVDAKQELEGKDLVCWCAPKRCHADTLLRIANES